MRAIMLMFDSLNRHYLPAWNEDAADLPNFRRLQEKTVVFDKCYAGSMPCMPARRDLHTARTNFLHRSWGPIEPFDDSIPEMLKNAGVHTHLATDHQHYWEDGGATYHNRYASYEFFRGQEGDLWKGVVADPDEPKTLSWRRGKLWRQDWVNRRYMQTHDVHPQTRTVQAGLDFIDTNKASQDWFLQIECFDPHEPFFASPEFSDLVGPWDGDHFDWPDYRPVLESPETVEHVRAQYGALLAQCDASLGRVLDMMDANDMWHDTALIVCTDHGLLLGEREWYGKNVQPWFNEIINTPLYVWNPRTGGQGQRRDALVQTMDLGPTLLDLFGLEPTPDMHGRTLSRALKDDTPIREAALFGVHGGHVNVTDGRYAYTRACVDQSNAPLEDYTLMPTRMDDRFAVEDLRDAELSPPFDFTKSTPVLKVRARAMGNPYYHGSRLYDLEADPTQTTPIREPDVERRMAGLMLDLMRKNDAPLSQYQRLGLPNEGPIQDQHLLLEKQWDLVVQSDNRHWKDHPAESFGRVLNLTLLELDGTDEANEISETLGAPIGHGMVQRFGHLTPWHLAVMLPSVTPARLRALDDKLKERENA